MRFLVVLGASLGILCGSGSVQAQEEDRGYVQLVNEYFLNTSVYPQERGEIQLTTYPRVAFEDGYRSALPVAVEVGLTDRWQIEVEWVSLAMNRPDGLPSRSGTGDFELETQYSIMNVGGSSAHLAFGLGVTLPAGSEEAGGSEGERELEPSIAVGLDFLTGGRPSQLFGQVAMGLVDGGEETSGSGSTDSDAHEVVLGVGYVIGAGRARWTAELRWATNEWDGGDESEFYISPGLVFDLPDTWEVGIGAPIGIGGDATSFGLSLFLLYEFELGDDE